MPSTNPWLVAHKDLPSWCHDNPAIIQGYRRVGGTSSSNDSLPASKEESNSTALQKKGSMISNRSSSNGLVNGNGISANQEFTEYEVDTFYKCWRSVWDYWHNETVNIHTHLWGSLLSISILSLHLTHHFSLFPILREFLYPITHHSIFYPSSLDASILSTVFKMDLTRNLGEVSSWRDPNWKDSTGFTIFLLSAFTCLGLSATFHTCVCHSQKVSKKLNQGDYVGIVILITGSFIPAVHYGFHCQPHLEAFYQFSITVLGSCAIYTVVNPLWSTSAYRPYRTLVFVSLGLSALFPVSHLSYKMGFQTLRHTMGLDWLLLSGTLYVVGALLYALRIPERFAPGRFDYVGASHQIFHVFILVAAFAHYVSLRQAYTFWKTVEVLGVPNDGGWFNSLVGSGSQSGKTGETVCSAFERFGK